MTNINYRDLLIKYIQHIREIEAFDRIEFYNRDESAVANRFSEEEWQALKECSETVALFGEFNNEVWERKQK